MFRAATRYGAVTIALFLTHQLTAAAPSGAWPTPPQQAELWRAPDTTLPAPVVKAAGILFQQGLADPRGCDYRALEVDVGYSVATHAWLLPETPGKPTRFAVCWDGIVYPVIKMGDPADLKTDVTAVLENKLPKPQDQKDILADHIPWGAPGVRWQEKGGVRSLLLLRLGEVELAEKMWAAAPVSRESGYENEDPYLALADRWLTVMWYRLLFNHRGADDPAALHWARELARIQPLAEAEADKHGYREAELKRTQRPLEGPLFFELKQVPALAADQERRANEPKTWRVSDPLPLGSTQEQYTAAEKAQEQALARLTIPELIAAMENVRAQKTGEPGGLYWEGDPIVRALLARGEPAVPALLQCWEKDPRLTRSLMWGRPWHRGWRVVPVKEVAEVIVSGVFKTGFKDLAEAKAYWQKFKNTPQEQRWFATLADDNAGTEQWLQAAAHIVQPIDVERSVSGWVTVPNRRPEDIPAFRGEALRQQKKPSVLELMAKRAAEISGKGEPGSEDMFALRDGCTMALFAARWDPRNSRDLLAQQMKRAVAYVEADRRNGHTSVDEHLHTVVGKLAHARTIAADPDALPDFAAYLKRLDPGPISFGIKDYLMPMWRHPQDPAMLAAARDMFLDKNSPWVPILQKSTNGYWARDLLQSPMLGVEPFRQYLLQQLADESPAAPITIQPGQQIEETADPLAPKPGTYPVRACDIYADAISQTPGMPWAPWYWPQEKRDAARREMIQRLKQYGPRFAWVSVLIPGEYPDDIKARMVFPKRDRPATSADVAKGQAIFSLEGQGETRLVPLDSFPARAKWNTLHDHPYQQSTWDPKTNKSATRIAYDQSGLIWQAEEVLQNGQWVRYYGFVGRHALSKVPAAEITLFKENEY